MLKSFFEDKFEFDYRSNQQWISVLEQNEDHIDDQLRKLISHILNVHHIWLSRLTGTVAESDSFDLLPISHWQSFAQQNYLQTLEYLKDLENSDSVSYESSEGEYFNKDVIDILYHILNHSSHHRGQISVLLRQKGLNPPSFNFISYH